MKLETTIFALRGCAARIAANRNELPATGWQALTKLLVQPRRDWSQPGAPRVGWKRGELFEVFEAVLRRDWQAASEELGDCAYYIAQSPLAFVLAVFPRRVLDNAVRKMMKRDSRQERTMNQVLACTNETIKNAIPEVGNLVGIFGLTYPGAAYGIVTEIVEVDGAHLVSITWFAPKTTRKRAHQENKHSNAARRVVVCDRMDVINQHYAQEA